MQPQIANGSILLRKLIILLCLLLVFPLESCAQAPGLVAEKEAIPIPQEAFNIERHQLRSESAFQVDFKVKAAYPNTNAARFYAGIFAERGWRECKNSDEWTEHVEQVGKSTYVAVRQKLQYLASKDERKLLLVALRYRGLPETVPTQSSKWNKDVQHVTVVLYDLRGKDFEKTLSLLSLRCGF